MSRGCSKCGTQNPDQAGFCRGCGAGLGTAAAAPIEPTATVACRACGALNPAGARFCANCGADPTPPPAIGESARRPVRLWIGVGVVAIALAASGGGAWWLNSSRSTALPSFDSAPPPSVLGAAGLVTPTRTAPPGEVPVAAPLAAPELPAPPDALVAPVAPAAPAAAASMPAGKLQGPVDKNGVVAESVHAKPADAKGKPARNTRARALREPRAPAGSQAATHPAQRRAGESRARPPSAQTPARSSAQAHPPARAPATRAARPVPPPAAAQARTVKARCASRNPIIQGICESRECIRPEHAAEPVCQRIKAADDQRRQQD